jgi:signal transduction histidine kinase
MILSFALSRGVTGPLNELVAAARTMGSGNLESPIPALGVDEVGFLARTLEESRQRLAERDKAQRAMVAGIAHEIRNPLGGIQIYVELLEGDPALSDAQRERVKKILLEIHRLGAIVEEFLAYARPQLPVRESFDPGGIVGETVDLLSALAGERRVRISPHPPSAPVRVSADSGQIRQTLLNLVRNSVEACPPGGEVRIAWEAEGDGIVLSVEDDGPGIPPADRSRIFEPFFSTKSDGAGLGLPIVRRLIEQNGGRIALDEERQRGCRFTMRLARAAKGDGLA